ncbi:hypothetical protein [Paraburkholderia fungorum]|uniref:hypothetical protein n=1 Tax=Paraburkholderia fungorum TaxID=134537 RepID=UPI0021B46C95|nr:hypothetical protein [Paraburkholderia fungorum]
MNQRAPGYSSSNCMQTRRSSITCARFALTPAGLRIHLRERRVLGARYQQIEIADQHVALDAAAQLIVGNHDAAGFDTRSIRTERDRHAILSGQHARDLAERRFERETLCVAGEMLAFMAIA